MIGGICRIIVFDLDAYPFAAGREKKSAREIVEIRQFQRRRHEINSVAARKMITCGRRAEREKKQASGR
ncbi:hypothetical protein [Amycolatopsis sp. NPDC059657]|uniref:hypothetical protein n=1 Tax=Amycolatopsis sp. NPDC059657 TaxID=3346899 RepID=UPI003670AA08